MSDPEAPSGVPRPTTTSGTSGLWAHGLDVPDTPLPETVDVLVVGAGITGLTTALVAAEQGASVAVLEAREVAGGSTGRSTGKITSQHGLRYASLEQQHGAEVARSYGAANERALRIVDDLVARYDLDCDRRVVGHQVFTTDPSRVDEFAGEAAAARRAGLPIDDTAAFDLPLTPASRVAFGEQRELDPAAYTAGLAQALTGLGGTIHERTRALGVSIDGRRRARVATPRGEVSAEHVVLATLQPPLDRVLSFAQQRPVRSYGIALQVEGALPNHGALQSDDPTRSVRAAATGMGEPRLVVVGEEHQVGHDPDPRDRIAALARFAEHHWPVTALTHWWSAQDYEPVDALPMVGPLDRQRRLWVACGFSKWGLSAGTHAGWAIARRLAGREVEHTAHLRRPGRVTLSGLRGLLELNLHSGKRFVGDRLVTGGDPAHLDAGEGMVIRDDGGLTAVHRRDDGSLCRVSATCTHLGCVVAWNALERSWDCPCHGSRFDAEGEVLEGPAIRPLAPRQRPG